MSVEVPQEIIIGSLDKKLDTFDDKQALTKNGGFQKINAIRVFYTDKYVRGFEIFYKLNCGDLLKAVHNVPKKNKELKSTVFEIGPDDYLSEIQGAFHEDKKKNKIINITFLTYRGKAGTYGGVGQKQFGYTFQNYTFGSFSGGYKKNIEWLKIQVLPLPLSFIEDINKIKVNVVIQPQPGQNIPQYPQFGNLGLVQKPQLFIGLQEKSLSFQENQYQQQQQPSQNLLSSKYPSFDKPAQQPPSYQNNSAQIQYPGNQQYQYPVQAYPGQMNQNPYYQKPQ